MVIDGFDTIIKKDLNDIEKIFKRMNCKILVSENTLVDNQTKPFQQYVVNKIYKNCKNYNLSAGLYMGYTKQAKYMLQEIIKSGEEDDQRAMTMLCNRVDFIKIDTDHIIFDNCFNNEKCVKNSNAYIVGTPGKLSVERYSRVVKEYGSYFVPEIVLLILVIFCIIKIVNRF
jgi:hypothetical protein